MGKIYVGFLSLGNDIFDEYLGWSKSEHLVQLYLKQFRYVVECGEETLAMIEMEESDQIRFENGQVVYLTTHKELRCEETSGGHTVILNTDIYMWWIEQLTSEMEYSDVVREQAISYNTLFMILDNGLIRPTETTEILKKMILLIYKKYSITDPSDLYFDFIDIAEYMISVGYIEAVM